MNFSTDWRSVELLAVCMVLLTIPLLVMGSQQAAMEQCGDQSAGDCCVANGTPFCEDAACCDAVCAEDPYCCDVAWDECCVNRAVDLCAELDGCHWPPKIPGCGDLDAGDCMTPNGSPACWDEECCTFVCTLDPFCCNVEWDGLCAGQAQEYCSGGGPSSTPIPAFSCEGNCGGAAASGCWCDHACAYFGDCCEDKELHCPSIVPQSPGPGGNDNDGASQGDQSAALDSPHPCAEGNPWNGDCFEPNDLPGCDDPCCCFAVCDCDPFCCGAEWDENCVGPNKFVEGCSALEMCPCITLNPADLTGNNEVNVDDLLILLNNWGECEFERCQIMEPEECLGDYNHDGWINVDDLLFLLNNWGGPR